MVHCNIIVTYRFEELHWLLIWLGTTCMYSDPTCNWTIQYLLRLHCKWKWSIYTAKCYKCPQETWVPCATWLMTAEYSIRSLLYLQRMLTDFDPISKAVCKVLYCSETYPKFDPILFFFWKLTVGLADWNNEVYTPPCFVQCCYFCLVQT